MVDIPLLKKAAEERLGKVTSTAVGRILVLAVMVGMGFGLGLGVLGVACLEVGEAKPGMKGLGAILTRLKVRPGARDRLRYVVSKGEVFFAPFRGGKGSGGPEDVAGAGEAVEMPAVPDLGDVDVDVDVDLGGLSGTRAGTLSTGGSASAGSAGAVAAAAKGAAAREGAGPKFNESAGKLNAKSVKKGRVTRAALATSNDRRATTSNKGDFGRAKTPVIGPARASETSAPAAKSGLDFLLGGSGAPGGAAAPSSAAPAPPGGGEGGGGSGSGGGDGSGPGSDDAIDPKSTMDAITALMGKAQKETDKAKDEMMKAKILAAGGHLPQAAYHYDRAEKAKKKSKEYSEQARSLTESISQQYQPPPAAAP